MQIDSAEIRFLTKVAEKSPRGLRLLLFKQKISGLEKLVFIVKTASQEIDKLALSKMTWQVEQSKSAIRVVVVRMLILPEGSKEFFQSETGLLMNEDKDRRSLQSLASQKSVEIYFFNFENEFHSKIELMTTYNMQKSAQSLIDTNPIIDQSRMIIKSENLSENDIKNAMRGKVNNTPIQDKDLMDSIQKKMPTVSNVSPKTKIEEFNKTSIKTNDMAAAGNFGNTIPPVSKKSEPLNTDDLKKAVSVPPGKLTAEELMKSIPPGKMMIKDILSNSKPPDLNTLKAEDLLKVVDSIPPGKITPEELMKSIPPGKLTHKDIIANSITPDLSTLKAEDLLKIVDSIPPGKITPEELLKSLPPNKLNAQEILNNTNAFLTPEELMNSLKESMPAEGGISAKELLRSTSKPGTKITDILGEDNLADIVRKEEAQGFFDQAPTGVIDNKTREMKKDDLLDALMSEETPLKLSVEEEKSLMSDLMSEPTPLKSSDGESELAKTMEVNIKNVSPSGGNTHAPSPAVPAAKKEEGGAISADDLLKALNGDM